MLMNFMNVALVLVLQVLLAIAIHTSADESFDVRQYLSTVMRYGIVKDISDDSFVPSQNLDQCTPIHLNLVARHGTRAPTKKRIRELEALAGRLEVLVRDAKEQKQSLDKIPAWLRGWSSPWKGKRTGGELISEGEDKLYHLGVRVREQFPDLFSEEYHSDIYSIKATQVPRASASAVAFGMGLFSGKGKLGPGGHRAFAVTSDIVLRFHDCCQSYKAFRKSQEPTVKKLKEPTLDEISHELVRRYGLNFTKQDVSSLWFLCKQEASLLNITNQACSLFSPAEVLTGKVGTEFVIKFLCWNMLLEDVIQSMEQAIKAKEGYAPGSFEKARSRLRFAHAETLLHFSCLIGLALGESGFTGCDVHASNLKEGCNSSDSCPFEAFKKRIVVPHLKQDYNALCNVNYERKEKGSAPTASVIDARLLLTDNIRVMNL
ncbi:hypothetical protein RND71_026037 [Anisodus tanguticus]|uniref:Multiple inositol polyphosphate phosphatase 1 n=1 Tax=Anisodus tanguticus TaxID=243964 RepID=A0AAE1V2H4_9SOLA|nr:hypothetical protein RND71_026037 [Anisodus tanguticus]